MEIHTLPFVIAIGTSLWAATQNFVAWRKAIKSRRLYFGVQVLVYFWIALVYSAVLLEIIAFSEYPKYIYWVTPLVAATSGIVSRLYADLLEKILHAGAVND